MAKQKKNMNFNSFDSLKGVENIVNEASEALRDPKRTIKNSSMSEVLSAAIGAGVGGAGSFAALTGLGVSGLSAAGITSGLATAGGLVGGGMAAGVLVLAAPVAVLAAGGVGIAAHINNKRLREEKERLYMEAVRKHEAIIRELKDEAKVSNERASLLEGLNVMLQHAINELSHDLNNYS